MWLTRAGRYQFAPWVKLEGGLLVREADLARCRAVELGRSGSAEEYVAGGSLENTGASHDDIARCEEAPSGIEDAGVAGGQGAAARGDGQKAAVGERGGGFDREPRRGRDAVGY